MASEGIIGVDPVFTKISFELRQNPIVYRMGNLLQGIPDGTLISLDRYGCFRPTKLDVKGASEWETLHNVHIDLVIERNY